MTDGLLVAAEELILGGSLAAPGFVELVDCLLDASFAARIFILSTRDLKAESLEINLSNSSLLETCINSASELCHALNMVAIEVLRRDPSLVERTEACKHVVDWCRRRAKKNHGLFGCNSGMTAKHKNAILTTFLKYDRSLRDLFACFAQPETPLGLITFKSLLRLAKGVGLTPETVREQELKCFFDEQFTLSSCDGTTAGETSLNYGGFQGVLFCCASTMEDFNVDPDRRLGELFSRAGMCAVSSEFIDSTGNRNHQRASSESGSSLLQLQRRRIESSLVDLGVRMPIGGLIGARKHSPPRRIRSLPSSLPKPLASVRPVLVRIVPPFPPQYPSFEVEQLIRTAHNRHNYSQYDAALDSYEAARRRWAEDGDSLPTEAVVFFHLAIGQVHESLEDDDKALCCYVRAKSAACASFHPDHPGIALCYHHLGCACFHLEYLDLAERCLNFSLSIQAKALGEGHTDTVATSHNIAACEHLRGNTLEARFGYKRAVLKFRELHGIANPRTQCATSNWTRLQVRQGTVGKGRPKTIELRGDFACGRFVAGGRFRILGDTKCTPLIKSKGGKKKKSKKKKKAKRG